MSSLLESLMALAKEEASSRELDPWERLTRGELPLAECHKLRLLAESDPEVAFLYAAHAPLSRGRKDGIVDLVRQSIWSSSPKKAETRYLEAKRSIGVFAVCDARSISGDEVRLVVGAEAERLRVVDLNRIADSACQMAWRENGEIRPHLPPWRLYGEVPMVLASEFGLCKLVRDVLVSAANAFKRMLEGQPDRHEIHLVTRSNCDGSAILEVTCTGAGMEQPFMAAIFDAVFMKGLVGESAALGLAINNEIGPELSGFHPVDSDNRKGPLFRLTFAAHPENAKSVKTPNEQPTRPMYRVLVIDDSSGARTYVRSISRLPEMCCEVVTSSARTFASSAMKSLDKFDTFVLDVATFETSGIDLPSEFSRMGTEQAERVIFLTVGVLSSATRKFLESVANPRLEKPVDIASLVALVEGVAKRNAPIATRVTSGTKVAVPVDLDEAALEHVSAVLDGRQ